MLCLRTVARNGRLETFLIFTCEREITRRSHVNHVYVRTWSFTFARED